MRSCVRAAWCVRVCIRVQAFVRACVWTTTTTINIMTSNKNNNDNNDNNDKCNDNNNNNNNMRVCAHVCACTCVSVRKCHHVSPWPGSMCFCTANHIMVFNVHFRSRFRLFVRPSVCPAHDLNENYEKIPYALPILSDLDARKVVDA